MKRLCAFMMLMSTAGLHLTAQEGTKQLETDPGTSAAVFYRFKAFIAGARRATINVDGKQICSLTNGSVCKVILPVGTHTITGPDRHKGAEVEMTAGTTYYFRAVLADPAPLKIRNMFAVVPVPPEQGEFEVKSLKPLAASDIKH